MHPAPMWPVKGYYQCPVCLRAYPVPWEHSGCSSHQPAANAILGKERTEQVASQTAVAALASR
jgi:hypothetical protein